ncbi:hypothetical protein FVF58_08655 [Paraburkholderia panacisoli]|uniref:Uncharacterized protein n=1 Tax=Paraburkholderia panacisoli TaxID=2603818 RepID=A0A5B0HFL5_9BURK|nr:hypothetical protein [Paraburkholderia panacisoli]KAA1013794.1 hypothetical protein FVF58_08655 [Paraburkholderia panacisoli]
MTITRIGFLLSKSEFRIMSKDIRCLQHHDERVDTKSTSARYHAGEIFPTYERSATRHGFREIGDPFRVSPIEQAGVRPACCLKTARALRL